MKWIAATIPIVANIILGAPSSAACEKDSLEIISKNGGVLKMRSGHVYRVDADNIGDTQLWLSGEDVLICRDTMINKDEHGERAGVTLLR
jgi:hypothetical protein